MAAFALKAAIEVSSRPEAIHSDAEASFKVTKTDDATYVIESLGPVVALRLLKAQPGAGLLGAENNWNDWIPVTGPTGPVKDKL